MRAERDKLAREAALRNEKERLAKELDRLKGISAANPAPGSDKPATNATTPTAATTPPGPKSISDIVTLCAPSVAVVKSRLAQGEGTGAGFLAFAPNHLITNYHVVSGSQTILVSFPGAGRQQRFSISGRVIAADPGDDLALVELQSGALSSLRLLDVQEGDIKAGGEVVAIGNPGMGDKILDESVSNGIISALDREIDHRHYLQTNAAINPGNSGGPLLDMEGKVIGVVSAKATQQENIGFAVPVATLIAFYKERAGKYKVTGDFRTWESDLPMMALKDQENNIALEGVAVDLLYDAETKLIVASIPERNKIALINQEQRKIEAEIFTGTDPAILHPGGLGQVWVCSLSSKNITLVNLRKRKVEKTYSLQGSPLDFAITAGGLWYFDETGTVRVVPLAGGSEQITPVRNIRSICYNGTRNNLWCGGADGYLYEIDGDRMAGLLSRRDQVNREMQDFNRDLNRASATAEQQNRLVAHVDELDKDVQKCIKKFNRPGGLGNQFDFSQRLQTLMVDNKKNRIYFNCCAFDAKDPEKIIGAFKNPDQHQAGTSWNQKLQSFFTKYPYYRQIRAISPDGKLASTGTHIFNTEDFTINRALPVPSPAIVFTPRFPHDLVLGRLQRAAGGLPHQRRCGQRRRQEGRQGNAAEIAIGRAGGIIARTPDATADAVKVDQRYRDGQVAVPGGPAGMITALRPDHGSMQAAAPLSFREMDLPYSAIE